MMARLVRLEVALLTLAAVLAVGIAVLLVRLDLPARNAAPAPARVVTPAPTALPAVPAAVVPVATPWTWSTWLPLAGLLAGGLLLVALAWRARQPLRRVIQRRPQPRAVAPAEAAPHRIARRRMPVRLPLRRWSMQGQAGLQRLWNGMQRVAQRLATQFAAVQVPSLPGRRRPSGPAVDPAPPGRQFPKLQAALHTGMGRAVQSAEILAALPPETLARMGALDPRAEREDPAAVTEAAPAVEMPPASPLILPPALDGPRAAPPEIEEELPLTATSSPLAPAPLPDLRAVVVPSAPPAVSALDRAQQAAVLLATGWATHGLTQPVLRLSADPKDGTVLVHLAPGAADDSALAGWLSTVGGSWRDRVTLRLPVADVALGMHQPPVLLPIGAERGMTHFWPLPTYGALGVYGAEAVPLALALLASALFQASPDTLALHLVDPANRLRPALADVPHTLAGRDDATVLARLPAALWQPLPPDGRLLLVVLVAPDAATLAALAPVYRRLRRRGAAGVALVLVCPTLDAAGRELYPVLPALITGASSGEAAWLPGHTWAAAGRVRGWSSQQDWMAALPPLDEGAAQQVLAGVRGAPRSTVPTVLDATRWDAAGETHGPTAVPAGGTDDPASALAQGAAVAPPLAVAVGGDTPPVVAATAAAVDAAGAGVVLPADEPSAVAAMDSVPAALMVPALALPDLAAPLEAPAVTFADLDADGQATVLALLGVTRPSAAPPETVQATDAGPEVERRDASATDAAPTWPAGAGLESTALAELVAAALAESSVEIGRKALNALLEQRGVTANQGVIAKELLPWLARAGVLAAQPRAPYRWLVTDLAAIAAALTAHPYEELTDGNDE